MKSFCQFVLPLSLLFLQACSWGGSPRPSDAELIGRVEPVWYGYNASIQLADWNGELQPHLFYDAQPELGAKANFVSFIPLSAAGSDVAFALDPVSGQRHFSHYFCSQDNVWGETGSVPSRPSFTYGVVPRHLDSLNTPQQIIVFGNAGAYDVRAPVSHRARIVGGVVLEECTAGACRGANDWASRIVLVGINDDGAWKDVKDFKQLQAKVNWQDVRAELENHQGRNEMSDKKFPAVKAGKLLEASLVMDHLKKNSLFLNDQELRYVNYMCAGVYDRLWNEVGTPQPEDAAVETPEQVKQFLNWQEAAKKEKKPWLFSGRMTAFLKREGEQFATCSRLVYAGDPNGNPEKFWFVTWMAMYARLHKEGFVFDCNRRIWNEENRGKAALENLTQNSSRCTNADYDKAMNEMPVFLRTLRGSTGFEWRFVGWDEGAQGSHAKLYSWVRVPARHFACSKDLNAPTRASWITRPDAGTWTRRHNPNKVGRGDIYVF